MPVLTPERSASSDIFSRPEVAVRAAASIADKAIGENRAVGLTVNAHRATVLPADRGARQRLKILQLLAAVEADGRTPLGESLVSGLNRLRHGMTAIIITASQDPAFIRPLATLRGRGIRAVVILLDAPAFGPAAAEGSDGNGDAADGAVSAETRRQRSRAIRHALAEYELPTFVVGPDRALSEVLAP